jgi:SPP1 gp7 family putative phage head morphogenesis protein
MNEADFQRVFNLPFREAEDFFRAKLNIPTMAWDELEGAAHAKGFMSAGAYNADLLADLRKMTDKAIAGGMDIREFRQQFRPLVEKYGWQLKGGGPAWRSDLIWRTNIQSAYQAGRWQQFEESGIEYLMYMHNDSVMHPRPHHVALDGKIFPRTDPFWSRNYPPQGFGCKCRAVAATRAEYESANPEAKQRPDGWEDMADKGWNYNVGQESKLRHEDMLGKKLASMDQDLAAHLLQSLKKELAPGNDAKWAQWVDDLHSPANKSVSGLIKTTGEMRSVWFVEPDISAALLDAGGPKLTTTLITATDKELLHTEHLADLAAAGGKKTAKKKPRPPERIVGVGHIKDLPKLVRDPQAVLYDTVNRGLVYVFEVQEAGKSGKWAVQVNLQDKKSRMVTNSLRSGAYVDTTKLGEQQYTLLKGRL